MEENEEQLESELDELANAIMTAVPSAKEDVMQLIETWEGSIQELIESLTDRYKVEDDNSDNDDDDDDEESEHRGQTIPPGSAEFRIMSFYNHYQLDGGTDAEDLIDEATDMVTLNNILTTLCTKYSKPTCYWTGSNACAPLLLRRFYEIYDIRVNNSESLLASMLSGSTTLHLVLQRLCDEHEVAYGDWSTEPPLAFKQQIAQEVNRGHALPTKEKKSAESEFSFDEEEEESEEKQPTPINGSSATPQHQTDVGISSTPNQVPVAVPSSHSSQVSGNTGMVSAPKYAATPQQYPVSTPLHESQIPVRSSTPQHHSANNPGIAYSDSQPVGNPEQRPGIPIYSTTPQHQHVENPVNFPQQPVDGQVSEASAHSFTPQQQPACLPGQVVNAPVHSSTPQHQPVGNVPTYSTTPQQQPVSNPGQDANIPMYSTTPQQQPVSNPGQVVHSSTPQHQPVGNPSQALRDEQVGVVSHTSTPHQQPAVVQAPATLPAHYQAGQLPEGTPMQVPGLSPGSQYQLATPATCPSVSHTSNVSATHVQPAAAAGMQLSAAQSVQPGSPSQVSHIMTPPTQAAQYPPSIGGSPGRHPSYPASAQSSFSRQRQAPVFYENSQHQQPTPIMLPTQHPEVFPPPQHVRQSTQPPQPSEFREDKMVQFQQQEDMLQQQQLAFEEQKRLFAEEQRAFEEQKQHLQQQNNQPSVAGSASEWDTVPLHDTTLRPNESEQGKETVEKIPPSDWRGYETMVDENLRHNASEVSSVQSAAYQLTRGAADDEIPPPPPGTPPISETNPFPRSQSHSFSNDDDRMSSATGSRVAFQNASPTPVSPFLVPNHSMTQSQAPSGTPLISSSPVGIHEEIGSEVSHAISNTPTGVQHPDTEAARNRQYWKAEIEKLYAETNPSKIPEIPLLLDQYQGSEAALYEAIAKKYSQSESESGSPVSFTLSNASPPRNIQTPTHISDSTITAPVWDTMMSGDNPFKSTSPPGHPKAASDVVAAIHSKLWTSGQSSVLSNNLIRCLEDEGTPQLVEPLITILDPTDTGVIQLSSWLRLLGSNAMSEQYAVDSIRNSVTPVYSESPNPKFPVAAMQQPERPRRTLQQWYLVRDTRGREWLKNRTTGEKVLKSASAPVDTQRNRLGDDMSRLPGSRLPKYAARISRESLIRSHGKQQQQQQQQQQPLQIPSSVYARAQEAAHSPSRRTTSTSGNQLTGLDVRSELYALKEQHQAMVNSLVLEQRVCNYENYN